MEHITHLLTEIHVGNSKASDELFQLVYDELRSLASAKLAQETPGQTLQPTALVHEVYVRLVGRDHNQSWDSVGHFFAAAAESMRRILVERARAKKSKKRGGDGKRIHLALEQITSAMDDEQILALDEALEQLSQQDPLKARLVVLRFFGGMSIEDACEVLGIARTTAFRHWTYARAWLFQRMNDLPPAHPKSIVDVSPQ